MKEYALTRRGFLGLSTLFVASLGGGFFERRGRDVGEIDFNEAVTLALLFDQKLGELDYTPLAINQKNCDDLVDRFSPVYQEQGFFDYTIRPEIRIEDLHFYFSGADCQADTIFVSPYEPTTLARNPDQDQTNPGRLAGAIAHELVHSHQKEICYQEEGQTSKGREETAQMVKCEVLASCARKGDRDALGGILFDLREMSLGTALFLAYHEDRMGEFDALVSRTNAGDFASFDLDYWQERREILINSPSLVADIYRKYEIAPLTFLMNVSKTNPKIWGLAVPPDAGGKPRVGIFDDFVLLLEQLQIP